MRNAFLILISFLIFSIPAQAAPILTVRMSGPGLSYPIGGGCESYFRPASQYLNFWDFFCDGCSTPPDLENRNSMDSSDIMILELNIKGPYFPISLFTRVFSADSTVDGIGSYSIEVSGDSSGLASTPNGMSSGVNLHHSPNLSNFGTAYPGGSGNSTYSISGVFDKSATPLGWSSISETRIEVTIFSSWYESGRPISKSIMVLSRAYKDSFSDNLILSSNLDDYPELKGTSGIYSITVTHLFTFASLVDIPAVPLCTLTATPASIKRGESSTLMATCYPAANSYVWSGGTCAGNTSNNCIVSPLAPTTYTVIGRNAGGNGNATSATVSTPPNIPNILMLLLH